MDLSTAQQLSGFEVKSFPWRRRGVLVPARDRRTAALGVCLFTASNPTPLRVQRWSFWATRLIGSRALPGRSRPWTAPVDPACWRRLVEAWVEAVGPVDAMALYQRRQAERDGITALLTRAGAPVAVVKLREDGASLRREQDALAAVAATDPASFSAPLPLGAGWVDDREGELHWSAQRAVFTRPHRPAFDAPDGLFDDVRRCLGRLAAGEDPAGTERAHQDLTPWNLRRDHRGRVWLYDWEDWAVAPTGADRAYFAATSHALTGRPMPGGLSPVGLQHWRTRVEQRRHHLAADVALDARILEGLDRALETAPECGGPV